MSLKKIILIFLFPKMVFIACCLFLIIIHHRGYGEVRSYEITYPPLIRAAADGDVNRVQKLIDQGAELDVRGFDGTTAVHYVVKNGDDTYSEKILHMLIDSGASVRIENDDGYEPILLVPYIANFDRRNRFIGELIMSGAELNEMSKLIETSTSGVVTGKKDTKRVALLEIMADNFDRGGVIAALAVWGPLFKADLIERARAYAYDKGFRDIAQAIVDYQRKPNVAIKGITPLMLEVLRGNEIEVTRLSRNSSIVNAISEDRFRQTALHLALKHRLGKIASILVENGANVDARDYLGNTPLHILARIKDSAIQKIATPILIGAGANVNAQNNVGNTPLMEAIVLKDREYAEYLINEYAKVVNITIRNRNNNSALDIARKNGLDTIARILEIRGRR